MQPLIAIPNYYIPNYQQYQYIPQQMQYYASPAQCPNTPYPNITHDSFLKNFYSDLNDAEKNIMYSSIFQETLYKNKRFEQLAKHGVTGRNYLETYKAIKDNTDFKDLINSNYFKGADGFLNILGTINSLKEQGTKKTAPISTVVGNAYITPIWPRFDYQKYDIPDYLKMLNGFTKSNVSDDLKRYYINRKISDIDVYYTSLNNLSVKADIVSELI